MDFVFLDGTRNSASPQQTNVQNSQVNTATNSKQQHIVQYQQHLACYTESERNAWITALRSASHQSMTNILQSLRSQLRAKVFLIETCQI